MTGFHGQYRRWKSRCVIALMAAALGICLVPLVSVAHSLVSHGAGVLTPAFFTQVQAPVGEGGGIAHAIIGSLLQLAVASAFAIPLGLAQGLYLSRYGAGPLGYLVRTLLEAMAGIPAIVIGVLVYTLVVMPMGNFSMLAGGMALGVIMLPIFARTSEEALWMVPRTIEEAGLALGLPRYRVTLRLVLRVAMPGVLTGLFLALARVAGEAAPLIFTSFGDVDFPHSLTQPCASLPVMLYTYAVSPFDEWRRQAWGAALVLVAIILAVRLTTHMYNRWRYGKGEAH